MNGMNSGDIPFDKLELGKKLGSGGFKDCYAGTYQGVGIRLHSFPACPGSPLDFHIHITSFHPQEPVAIGELRITQFTELDLAEIKHEINVLKYVKIHLETSFVLFFHVPDILRLKPLTGSYATRISFASSVCAQAPSISALSPSSARTATSSITCAKRRSQASARRCVFRLLYRVSTACQIFH